MKDKKEEEAKKALAELEAESNEANEEKHENGSDGNEEGDTPNDTGSKNLGSIEMDRVKKQRELKEESAEFAKTHGYIPVNYRDMFPSKGMFYPEGTKISAKSASPAQIKDYSMLDETDMLNVSEHILDILKENVEIFFPTGKQTISALKEIDKYPALLFVRDITMRAKQREKKITQEAVCPTCGKDFSEEITATSFMNFAFPKWLMKYYDQDKCCFHILEPEENVDLKIYMPSIDTPKVIKNLVVEMEKQRQFDSKTFYDRNFVSKYLPYLVPSSKSITQHNLKKLQEEFDKWNEDTLQAAVAVIDAIKGLGDSQINFGCDKASNVSEEGDKYCFKVRIRFPEGHRSLFSFSGLNSKLFADTK